ncbi:MAG: CRISPR-associated endonuclease Cas2 [Clostridiales bacterium]|nr:CRISPR-associated endonuclease Cas2 [Clostridiales bacterium]
MFVLITYDVEAVSESGAKRLRKVAKICEHYGIRVQNSVFEVIVDATQLTMLKNDLKKVIDSEKDSVRFYRLGNSYKHKIETMGKTSKIQAGEPLLL